MSLDPITAVADLVKIGVNKIFPDADAKQQAQLEQFTKELNGQVKVLVTEMSGNWLQRSWRPILMLSITLIVINNYIIYPYLSLFSIPATALDLPEHLWSLMKIGVGGYVVGRSGEKMVQSWKGS